MCGRHSKGQCTPAENGNVERVTEVDAQWAAHPIPVYRATLVAPVNTTL